MKLVRLIGPVCIAAGMLIFLTPQIRQVQLQQELNRLRQAESVKVLPAAARPESAGNQEETREEAADAGAASERDEGIGAAKEKLYEQMESYNQTLFEKGQEIAGPEAYENNPTGEDGAVGSVWIPDMDVELPLYLGATYEHLDKGAAVLGGTSMPIGGINTNCVISGHRSWCGAPYFRDIDLLKAGSQVVIKNGRETLYYRVFEKQIILPDNTEAVMIRPGKDLVTLITCHPYLGGGTHRYIVYCERCEGEGEKAAESQENTDTVRESDTGRDNTEMTGGEGEAESSGRKAQLIRFECFVRYAAAVVMVAAGAASLVLRGRNKRRK